ncbi:MAG: HAMP domain-containing protein [Deltaproteobacteria bacterium]|nr:HAMP domain-containing protein [Deltaproteobacteria bacterium]
MLRPRTISLKMKLTLMAMTPSLLVLLLAGMAFVMVEIRLFRGALVKDVVTLAEVIGTNNTAALSFADADSATRTFATLASVPYVLSATLSDKDGQLFARYIPPLEAKQTPVPVAQVREGHEFTGDRLQLTQKVVLDGEPIGFITILADTRDLQTRLRWYSRIVALVVCCGAVVSYLFATVLRRGILTPILQLVAATQKVSHEKDYRVRVAITRGGELGTLVSGFNEMLDQIQGRDEQLELHRQQLENQLAALQEGTQTLAASVSQITTFLAQSTSSTTETATAVNETAITVEEVKQTAYVANQKAQEITETSRETVEISKAGEHVVEKAVTGMTHVREQMASVARSVARLGEQSQAIEGIITTVADLAERSNLLAINAAIEATKAGAAGKGFAVVAQEVRTLAEQSKRATAQVRAILNDIQAAAHVAVSVTEQGTRSAEQGVRQSLKAGETIQALSKTITEAVLTISQIAASSQQQLIGMDQVASAMTHIRSTSNHNVESLHQLEGAAVSLQEVGQTLTSLTKRSLTGEDSARLKHGPSARG